MRIERKAVPRATWKALTALLERQLVGVLATFDGIFPYTSIVAFAAGEDQRSIVLATRRETRKFANMRTLPRASLLVDDRSNRTADFHGASAVTARGHIRELEGTARAEALARYLRRHPYLCDFVRTPDCAVLSLHVVDYLLVQQFQKVTEIAMETDAGATP